MLVAPVRQLVAGLCGLAAEAIHVTHGAVRTGTGTGADADE